MSIQQKREQRKGLAVTLNQLVTDHPKDEAWSDDKQKKYDDLVNKIDALDGDLDRQQKVFDLQAKSKQTIQDRADQGGISTDEAEHQIHQEKAAYASWLRGGMSALNEDQRSAVQARINSPKNAMSTGQGSEGGYLTADEIAPGISQALKAYGGMRELATVVPTATGSTIPWPTANATAEQGEWLAENTQAGDEDTTFGVRNIETHMISSKVITVPFQLLQDTQFNLEGYINEQIGMRIGRTSEDAFINGTGTSMPHGILTDTTAGKVGVSGQTSIITLDDLIDLEHSVDPAYRRSAQCGFMMNDSTIKVVKKLKDTQGRPLWLPGIEASEPNTILGKAYATNQHIPAMAANAKSVLFGDFSKYIVRDVSQMLFFRFTDSAYSRKGQVGFLAFMRTGGRCIDVGGAVKYYQNAAA
ncbi:phage major capsid protein [uncultured Pseudoalteromonas sp.]|uniref:phage major capsid protein n=1 Tax=uncultured Pseudoalteromonas sp. TaxID=114053 RepID=UPI002596C9A2|nr:phage major capsid protein [uncultured Pseudoalteromonas sp.]